MKSTPKAFLVGLLLATMYLAGCSEEPRPVDPEARKLVVIGIDSADWKLYDPMLVGGRLPNLQAFKEQAAYGKMRTFIPLEKSPLLWASICTGVNPEVHGVSHFVRGSQQKPVTGSAWRAPAIWDILGAADLTTAIMAMWTTYPARPINGVMVSDYLPYGRARQKALTNLVFPDSLSDIMMSLRVNPDSLSSGDLARFIDEDKIEHALEHFGGQIADLRDAWAADLTYVEVGRYLASTGDFDLFFFYLRGPDMVSHDFYRYLVPDQSKKVMKPGEVETFAQVVPRYYEWVDEVLADVLSWFPPDRQVVILSDHGFYGPRASGKKGAAEHREWGIFMVRSPHFLPGTQFDKLELLDICPTFLGLMNLPAAQDMPGSILMDGLSEGGRKHFSRLEKHRVSSYRSLRPLENPEGEEDAVIDEEIRKQLRSLGYIQ